MKQPFFSVIIPLFNKDKYIENALLSILNQSFSDFEIIIVNDGSTDNSIAKVTPYLSEKIRLIEHEKNKGLSAARNTGIKNSKADYITFLDADDLWLPTFLVAINYLIQNFSEAHIFATNIIEVYPKKLMASDNISKHIEENSKSIVNFFKANLKQGIYNACSVCYHKSVFDVVGFYNESIDFSEDLDFNIRVNLKFKLAYDTNVHVNYFMETDNQMTRNSILNKRLPDYNLYESFSASNPDLKKYLDFERYVLAKHLKLDGDTTIHKEIIARIDFRNLNYKQRLLLKSPRFVLQKIKVLKYFLIRRGIKLTSY
jgi:glycosyltransferase involved in cell wall biosynthesis